MKKTLITLTTLFIIIFSLTSITFAEGVSTSTSISTPTAGIEFSADTGTNVQEAQRLLADVDLNARPEGFSAGFFGPIPATEGKISPPPGGGVEF